MPKKLKSENNLKIEALFGNMQKDSKKQKNIKRPEDKQNNKTIKEKSSEEKKNTKKEEKLSPKNKKSKIIISEKEKKKEEENKKLLKPTKKTTSIKKEEKKEEEKNKKISKPTKKTTSIEKEEKKGKNGKNKKSKKYISDEESYSLPKGKDKENDIIEDIDFSDYKMEIEEEEKEILPKHKNKSKSKSKSNSKKSNVKLFDEEIDLEKLENMLDEEGEEEEEKKINKKNKKEKKDKKDKKESTNKKGTNVRKKSRDVKISTNKKGRKESSSSNTNQIDGPLSDETIVLTGEFSLKRDEMTDILKSLGARVTGSVSSRTTILLHGELLEDGRPFTEGRKYRLAKEKKITTMDITAFEKYVQDKTKNPNWTIDSKANNKNIDLEIEEEILNEPEEKTKNMPNNNQNQGELWTTKYHPKKISDLIGNKTNINKLIEWLDDWNAVVLEGKTKKVEAKFHRGQRPTFENVNARACLITGDPGIGKTSSVRLIAKLKGYKTYETNASDQRNKNSVNKNAGFMFDNKTLFGGELQEKNLIIMDEVDGMSGNEDRGGIAAIIDIIKKTKTPIICIANDRQSPKLKTLANYCYDLKFVHPDKRTIALRLAEICQKENIQYEINALEYLCEICGNDIRQIMNYIELWTRTHKSIKYKDLTGGDQKIQGKDEVVMLKNFDAAKELLSCKSHSLPYRQLLDLYFIDYDLIPLLIQENYLSTFPSKNFKNKKEELESISLSADLISESDVIDKKIRTNMDWRLLSDRGLIGCCTICKLNKGFVPFPKFPEALGKISSLNKIKRETTELKECFTSASGEEIRRQILPVFYTHLINFILDGDIDGILETMKKYHITMEMFKENMTDLVGEKLKLTFEKIGTANKSNLTRAYNKNFKTSIIRNKNKKGKKSSSVNLSSQKVYDENGNPLNDEEGEEIEEENDESSESVVNTQKEKTKGKGKSKSKPKEDNKKSKSKNKTKGGKTKGKVRKSKKKKDEYEESEFSDE